MTKRKQGASGMMKEADNIPLEDWMLEMQESSQEECMAKEDVSKADRVISWTHVVPKSPNIDVDPVTGEIHKPANCESCEA